MSPTTQFGQQVLDHGREGWLISEAEASDVATLLAAARTIQREAVSRSRTDADGRQTDLFEVPPTAIGALAAALDPFDEREEATG